MQQKPKPHFVVEADETDSRLDHFLKRKFPEMPFTMVAKLVRKGDIRLGGKKTEISAHVMAGDQVSFPAFLQKEGGMTQRTDAPGQGPLSKEMRAMIRSLILFEDESLLVINKPAGLAVQGGSNLRQHLDALLVSYYADQKITPRLVHRLDKETSGVLLVGKTLAMTKYLNHVFQQHLAEKTYLALTHGILREPEGIHRKPLRKRGGKEPKVSDTVRWVDAETRFELLGSSKFYGVSLVELLPKTGRTHQLRLHLEDMGSPILGDEKYGDSRPFLKENGLPRRLYLHAKNIKFPLPEGGNYSFHAPVPLHFEEALRYFRLEERAVV